MVAMSVTTERVMLSEMSRSSRNAGTGKTIIKTTAMMSVGTTALYLSAEAAAIAVDIGERGPAQRRRPGPDYRVPAQNQSAEPGTNYTGRRPRRR